MNDNETIKFIDTGGGCFMAEFGEQLKKARENKGMTQQSLAEKMYVTRQTVYRWECGNRYPDIINLKRLADILEVSTDYLLSDEDMGKVAEKQPIVEKPSINNITVCLNFLVCIMFLIIFVRDMTGLSPQAVSVLGDEIRGILMFFIKISEAGLFLYGLINLIMGKYTPRKVGAVSLCYLLLEALAGIKTIYLITGDGRLNFTFVLIFPYLICAAGTFLFFFLKEKRPYARALVYIGAAVGIVMESGMVFIHMFYQVKAEDLIWNLIFENGGYFLLVGILKIAAMALMIYQVFVLNRRRKVASDISK